LVQVKFPQAALVAVIPVGLVVGGGVAVQFSVPGPTSIPSLGSAVTPVPGLIVTPTPTATRVPGPQLPSDIEEALRFLRQVAQRYGPWGVAAVLLLYWLWKSVDELILGLLGRIPTWVKDGRRNLLARLGLRPDQPTRALLKHVFERCERLEIKGIAREKVTVVSLESIYVTLFMAGEAAPGLGHLPRGGEVGLMMVRAEAERLVPVAGLLPKHRRLVIVGEAGSGKTTFLRYVALTLAKALEERRPAYVRRNLNWDPRPVPLPILLPLGGFGLYLKGLSDAQRESPNPDLLLDYLNYHLRHLDLPEGFLEQRLEGGNCLLLLDGLDEVARFSDRQFISETVTLFSNRYEKCRFVVTCRPEGYQGAARLGGDFHKYELEPLRWPEDIAVFVRRWNEAVLGVGTRPAQENTEDFLRRLEEKSRCGPWPIIPCSSRRWSSCISTWGNSPKAGPLYDTCTELLLGWDARWGHRLVAPPP